MSTNGGGSEAKGRVRGGDSVQQLLVALGASVDAVHVDAAFALPYPQQRLLRNGHWEGKGVEVGSLFQEHIERVVDVVADVKPVVVVRVEDHAGGDPFRLFGKWSGQASGGPNRVPCVGAADEQAAYEEAQASLLLGQTVHDRRTKLGLTQADWLRAPV